MILVNILFLILLCFQKYAITTAIDDYKDAGDPLILTPLIESGQIEDAKKKAFVEHKEIPNIESYSGLLTVNKKYDANLFFWYFPAQQNRENAPVILWITGGPGSTSLLGLFAENGPFTVTVNQTVEMRDYSWTVNHHMIYLDSPVDAGFSFTNDDAGFSKTADDVGRDVVTAFTQFFKLFPEIRKNDLHVIGESLAGKFSPAVAHAIQLYNDRADDKINLQGLVIACGVADPVNQIKHSGFMYEMGLMDADQRDEFKVIEDKLIKAIKEQKIFQSINAMSKLNKQFTNMTGFEYYFHALRPIEPDFINPFVDWVQRSDVRKAIHVGNITFERSSAAVKKHIAADMITSVAEYIAETLYDHKVLIYVGQLDFMVPYAAMENYVSKLVWPGSEKYAAAAKKKWYVGKELAGYVKSAGKLTSIMVRNAGHMLTNDQPIWAADMITRFTHDKEF